MREIKYRAWNLEKDKWLDEAEHFVIDQDGVKSIIDYVAGEINIFDVSDKYTIMQYTGLKDKNEKEIYEGDIVKQNYLWETNDPQTLGSMEVDREIMGVVGIDGYGSYTMAQDKIYYWLEYLELSDQLEVIGNIYDNPEIMN